MAQIELFYLAHSRTGDKGDSQTMSLIPYRAELIVRTDLTERKIVFNEKSGLLED